MATAPDRPPTVLPVGLFVGSFPGDLDDDAEPRHEIRRGTEIHEVSDDEFLAWVAAHGTDETPAAGPPSLDLVERELRAQGLAAPAAVVDRLLDRGLLTAFPSDDTAAAAFARAHRVVPTLLGLGNSPEEPELYSIGLIGAAVVQVSRPVFELWSWAGLEADLWSACESFAAQEREAGGTDPELCDPGRVLAGFLTALAGLLAVQAVYLDVVRRSAVLEGLR
ncbi:hypothetical protein [Micromonospora sp. HM5-17]|uniref:hypothetical protein n=1 Tax=Micromonospora sp. HM5-17 TaxID=2487710 RepID=UPI0011CD7417|nr:hypothetical protein [Micromonospora sp. HM5-17]